LSCLKSFIWQSDDGSVVDQNMQLCYSTSNSHTGWKVCVFIYNVI